jgi:hypothetical protein
MGLRSKIRSIIRGGSVRQKFCIAHEKTKRRWIGDKWGSLCGERSEGRMERQMEKDGELERRRFGPGKDVPLGWMARSQNNYYGIVAVRLRRRQEQRAIKRANRKRAAFKPAPPPVERPDLPPVTRPPTDRSELGALQMSDEQLALNAKASADILAILAGKTGPPPKR